MKNLFVCPHCQSVLNPNVKILLVASYGKKRGLVLLSPQPGNYKFIADSSFEDALRPGASLRLSMAKPTPVRTSRPLRSKARAVAGWFLSTRTQAQFVSGQSRVPIKASMPQAKRKTKGQKINPWISHLPGERR